MQDNGATGAVIHSRDQKSRPTVLRPIELPDGGVVETLILSDHPVTERERRANLVREVREVFGSVDETGDAEHRAAQDAWVRGELSLDELIERVQR